jgi:hypothetical protein
LAEKQRPGVGWTLTPGLLSSGVGWLAGMQPPASFLALWMGHAVGGYRRGVGGLGFTPEYTAIPLA